jgi:hypothetical protein
MGGRLIIAPTRASTNGRKGHADAYKPQIKLSVNVSAEQGERLRTLAFEQRVSESSIVQVALHLFFEQGEDRQLGATLREHGATLRRK